jgi:hypothetical protein
MAGLCRDASLGGQHNFLRAGRARLTKATSDTFMIVTPSANLSVEVKSATWVRYLTRAALASAGLLLLSNLPLVSTRLHAYLSAVPLAVAGVGYAMLQFRVRPAGETLLKRLLLAATFMVWAVDQLLFLAMGRCFYWRCGDCSLCFGPALADLGTDGHCRLGFKCVQHR